MDYINSDIYAQGDDSAIRSAIMAQSWNIIMLCNLQFNIENRLKLHWFIWIVDTTYRFSDAEPVKIHSNLMRLMIFNMWMQIFRVKLFQATYLNIKLHPHYDWLTVSSRPCPNHWIQKHKFLGAWFSWAKVLTKKGVYLSQHIKIVLLFVGYL